MPEFRNYESIYAWGRTQTHQAQIAFAARCALRSIQAIGDLDANIHNQHSLKVFRATLTSAVASVRPTSEVRRASLQASDAIDFSTGSKLNKILSGTHHVVPAFLACKSACHCSGFDDRSSRRTETQIEILQNPAQEPVRDPTSLDFAVGAATSGEGVFVREGSKVKYWDSVGSDADYIGINVPVSVFDTLLWPEPSQDARPDTRLSKLRDFLRTSEAWSFWSDWYEGMLKGEPLSWELQRDVVLIPDDIWQQGADAVAEEIRKIKFRHRTAAVQRLVRDEEANVFRVEDEKLPPKELADFVCSRVELALGAALKSVSHNIFNETSYEAITIRDTLASDPQSISILAVGFYDAALAFQKNIGDRYPDEVALTNLMNALAAATEELCELDDNARIRCAKLAGYNPKKSVDDLKPDVLREIPENVADQVDDQAREIIESDVERALSKEKPPTRVTRIRLSNWLNEISMWMDRAMKGDKRAKWLADVVKRLRDWWPDGPAD